MQKTTVYFPDELKEALARASRVSGRSEAELVRDGVRIVTQQYASPEPILPLFSSGDPHLAEQVDEALVGFGER